ncbi:hypothetical protein TNCV_2169501 [Trichonephila clavipes]|nr:hypothetical protein TNCV_2169501 [Trichonephila clavipes]
MSKGVHCFIYPSLETTGVWTSNGAMNGEHDQWNGTTLCLLMNPVSECSITRDTPPAATSDQLWQYVEAARTAVPQGYIQSLFDSMPRRVAVVITNNNGCTNY